jgi:hypothetical protein
MTARNRIGACVILFSALASMPAAARDRAHVYHGGVRAACGKEINSQCSGVLAGGGNLVSCFLVSQPVMSPQCKAAVYSAWDRRRQGG